MASDFAATATSPAKPASKQQSNSTDEILLGGAVLGIAAGIILYLRQKKPVTVITCQPGYTLDPTTGECVTGAVQGATSQECGTCPPGFPPTWCTWDNEDQMIGIVWLDMLNRFPLDTNGNLNDPNSRTAYESGGVSGVAKYIADAPGGEFIDNVMLLVNNPPADAPSDFSGTNAIIQATIYRILGRFFDPGANWPTYTAHYNSGGIPLLAADFYNSAEFQGRIPSQVASSVCT